ncbi:type IA DNA topoisomerase [Eubacterium oxidoreducens]|uniref:DNA topoisomerase n=1 Tax=Eubacterium oxidoreducens TaxID=1732 RepID=A0A1G6C3W9_EUBOX|nr:type IA DNA topoisomerase [Eubacterium oxidoreducens]SDB27563.1 DNA topoisomerase-3 [Eubacterium oxidoreducens]
MKSLLIAEKPSLMRQIKEVYTKHRNEIKDEIIFSALHGHILRLVEPREMTEDNLWDIHNLPFNPKDYGGWNYRVEDVKTYRNIKELMSGVDYIIHAGDADREGELLVREVLVYAKNKLPVKRYWLNSTTDKDILNALLNLRDDSEDFFENLYHEALIRQRLDYLFGMNATNAITNRAGMLVKSGRVKSAIVAMVVNRENEINNFVPSKHYTVNALLDDFDASNLAEFQTKEKAEDFAKSLDKVMVVTDFEKKEKKVYPPKLFKLSTLQAFMAKDGIEASMTLAILQELYEKGYVTYPRTGCEYLSESEDLSVILKTAKEGVMTDVPTQVDMPKGVKKFINQKEVDKEGHTALIVTSKRPTSLSGNHLKVYETIKRRCLMMFMPPAIFEETIVTLEVNDEEFTAKGLTAKDKGYFNFDIMNFPKEVHIPSLIIGQELNVMEYKPIPHEAKKPTRFTDATMIMALENPSKYLNDISLKSKELSVGTPATRAGILSQLTKKDKNGNVFLTREKNRKVYQFAPTKYAMDIVAKFGHLGLFKVDMTGEWENMLGDIRSGKLDANEALLKGEKDVQEMIEEIKKIPKSGMGKVICECPFCGGDILEGKKAYFCSNWKEKGCSIGIFKEFWGKPITKAEVKDLLTKGFIVKSFESKKGNPYKKALDYNKNERKVTARDGFI